MHKKSLLMLACLSCLNVNAADDAKMLQVTAQSTSSTKDSPKYNLVLNQKFESTKYTHKLPSDQISSVLEKAKSKIADYALDPNEMLKAVMAHSILSKDTRFSHWKISNNGKQFNVFSNVNDLFAITDDSNKLVTDKGTLKALHGILSTKGTTSTLEYNMIRMHIEAKDTFAVLSGFLCKMESKAEVTKTAFSMIFKIESNDLKADVFKMIKQFGHKVPSNFDAKFNNLMNAIQSNKFGDVAKHTTPHMVTFNDTRLSVKDFGYEITAPVVTKPTVAAASALKIAATPQAPKATSSTSALKVAAPQVTPSVDTSFGVASVPSSPTEGIFSGSTTPDSSVNPPSMLVSPASPATNKLQEKRDALKAKKIEKPGVLESALQAAQQKQAVEPTQPVTPSLAEVKPGWGLPAGGFAFPQVDTESTAVGPNDSVSMVGQQVTDKPEVPMQTIKTSVPELSETPEQKAKIAETNVEQESKDEVPVPSLSAPKPVKQEETSLLTQPATEVAATDQLLPHSLPVSLAPTRLPISQAIAQSKIVKPNAESGKSVSFGSVEVQSEATAESVTAQPVESKVSEEIVTENPVSETSVTHEVKVNSPQAEKPVAAASTSMLDVNVVDVLKQAVETVIEQNAAEKLASSNKANETVAHVSEWERKPIIPVTTNLQDDNGLTDSEDEKVLTVNKTELEKKNVIPVTSQKTDTKSKPIMDPKLYSAMIGLLNTDVPTKASDDLKLTNFVSQDKEIVTVYDNLPQLTKEAGKQGNGKYGLVHNTENGVMFQLRVTKDMNKGAWQLFNEVAPNMANKLSESNAGEIPYLLIYVNNESQYFDKLVSQDSNGDYKHPFANPEFIGFMKERIADKNDGVEFGATFIKATKLVDTDSKVENSVESIWNSSKSMEEKFNETFALLSGQDFGSAIVAEDSSLDLSFHSWLLKTVGINVAGSDNIYNLREIYILDQLKELAMKSKFYDANLNTNA